MRFLRVLATSYMQVEIRLQSERGFGLSKISAFSANMVSFIKILL